MSGRVYEGHSLEALLPHRYPFLLVDRIEVADVGHHVTGMKRLTAGEWWLEGVAAMPFPLVLEALAQAGGALVPDLLDGAIGAVAYFMGADHVRYRHQPEPGDTLLLDVDLVQWRRGVCRTHGEATVDGRVVLTADLTTIVRTTTSR